jgi:circadian clock protein KaiB
MDIIKPTMINLPAIFKFRLYVAGSSPNSMQAVANLNGLCREHLPDRHQVEIVDVLREPRRALDDGILLTPMLIKLSPEPICKIIGNLSESRLVLSALGLIL